MLNAVMLETRTNRGADWLDFATLVLQHSDLYVVPQYGDSPNDPAEVWSVEDCILQISKYSGRFGRNVREGQEKLDLLKIAHCACLAHSKIEKLEKEEKTEDNYEKELHNELIAYLLTEKDGKGVEKNAEDIIQIMKDKVRGRGGF